MKRTELKKVEHSYKKGDKVPSMEPNITESTLLTENGEVLGFYLNKLPEKLQKILQVIDCEFHSEAVPKSVMERVTPTGLDSNGKNKYQRIKQLSTILGSLSPAPHMKRNYTTRSSVHKEKKAETFVKAMLLAGSEALKEFRRIAPAAYVSHQKSVLENSPENFRFAGLFTSTISNSNISADIHRDGRNIQGAFNIIITRRRNSKGGCLFVPDYDAVFACENNSMIVYPAWRNLHGVTPIEPTYPGGYRDTHIWYALKNLG